MPMKFLEMHVHEACERFHTNTEMLNAIKSLQDFAVTLNKLEKSTLDHPVSVEVYLTSAVNSSLPRYTVTLVDTKKSDFTSKRHGKYAVFIVPQGQESEAMFSTNEGMRELAKMVGFDRLAIVYLHRGQIYANLEEIKSELSQKIMELCQKGIDSSQQVPFLTSGDCLGVRDICCKVNSSFYGNFIVEDFKSNEGTYYRQLIFINQSLEIHCKARLMSSKNKNKKIKKRIIDHRYLCSRHSKEILASILFNQEIVFSEITTFSMLFIGVRSACVIGFLYMLFPQISIQILEKDEQMIQVMERWYDLSPSSIHVNDKVLENSKKVFDVIVADSFSEDIHNLTNVGSLLKDTGVIVSVNLLFKSSTDFSFRCFFCDDSTNTQDSTNICQTNIRYFISRKCETNLSALTNILEMRIHQFKQFIATCRKDFYDKMEWNTLDNLHKLAEMEEISFNNKSENTSEKLSE